MAGILNIKIDQGCTYKLNVIWKDEQKKIINLTNYTAQMQIRKTTEEGVVLVDIESPASGIVIENNTIKIEIPPEDTKSIIAGRHVYSLVLTNSVTSEKYRLLQGVATVSREVTRIP